MQMMKIIALSLLALAAGCVSRQTYLEGSHLALGIYIPAGGQLYGVQALSWLSGCKIDISTNQQVKVFREYSASNDYFGIVHIREKTKTQIEPANK